MSTSIKFISDTHNKHDDITNDLPGGDILIHSGDITKAGYDFEVKHFLDWFSSIGNSINFDIDLNEVKFIYK